MKYEDGMVRFKDIDGEDCSISMGDGGCIVVASDGEIAMRLDQGTAREILPFIQRFAALGDMHEIPIEWTGATTRVKDLTPQVDRTYAALKKEVDSCRAKETNHDEYHNLIRNALYEAWELVKEHRRVLEAIDEFNCKITGK